jgi:hypothetical protein
MAWDDDKKIARGINPLATEPRKTIMIQESINQEQPALTDRQILSSFFPSSSSSCS